MPHSPVDANDAQAHDGRRAAHDVHGDEDIAEELAKDPAAADQVRDAHKGHDGERHRQVGQRQRHDQVVGRLAQLLDEAHGDDHQQVATDGGQRKCGERAPDHHLLCAPVAEDLFAAARSVALGDHPWLAAGGGDGRCGGGGG